MQKTIQFDRWTDVQKELKAKCKKKYRSVTYCTAHVHVVENNMIYGERRPLIHQCMKIICKVRLKCHPALN